MRPQIRPRIGVLWLLAVTWFLAGSTDAEDVLQAIRAEVRSQSPGDKPTIEVNPQPRERDPSATRRDRDYRGSLAFASYCDDDDDDDDINGLVARIFFYVATSPFWVPPVMLHDDFKAESYFTSYPYEKLDGDRYSGFMMLDPKYPQFFSRRSLRVTGQYGTTFDDLSHLGGRLQFDGRRRFGIDASAKHYFEDRSDGTQDELTLGDVNMVFRFAQSRRVQMRTGIGFNWLSDADQNDFGFNFTYGGDWFPDDPFVVSTDFDCGGLGDSHLLHVRITGGILLHNVESFMGYDYLNVGGVDHGSLIAGIRFWF